MGVANCVSSGTLYELFSKYDYLEALGALLLACEEVFQAQVVFVHYTWGIFWKVQGILYEA